MRVEDQGDDLNGEADRGREHGPERSASRPAKGPTHDADHVARHEQQRGMERGEPSGPLQVHDHEEQHGEVGEALEQRGQQRRGHGRDAEQGEVEHRLGPAALDQGEGGHQHHAPTRKPACRGVEADVASG